jgi:hypothetical protein
VDIRELGISFYLRLLGKEASELKKGDFSHEEANEGLYLLRQG